MAYVNVLEWKSEHVAAWLSGLDDGFGQYISSFINNNVTGHGLLNLTVDDLNRLNVKRIGHQLIILHALQLLKNLHYNLDSENLQYLCLKLSCKARSLINEIRVHPPPDPNRVETWTMLSVAEVIDSLSLVIVWLDSTPAFSDSIHYSNFKSQLVRISLALATNTHRDMFAEKPVQFITDACEKLASLCDTLIQDVVDSLILEPAYLDISTVPKRRLILSNRDIQFACNSYHSDLSRHVIKLNETCGIQNSNSTRHKTLDRSSSSRNSIQSGDEIVQINYQTVVGWSRKHVLNLLSLSSAPHFPNDDDSKSNISNQSNSYSTNVILTVKKRPRRPSSLMTGQIYIKPFRIPANRRQFALQDSCSSDSSSASGHEKFSRQGFEFSNRVVGSKNNNAACGLSNVPAGHHKREMSFDEGKQSLMSNSSINVRPSQKSSHQITSQEMTTPFLQSSTLKANNSNKISSNMTGKHVEIDENEDVYVNLSDLKTSYHNASSFTAGGSDNASLGRQQRSVNNNNNKTQTSSCKHFPSTSDCLSPIEGLNGLSNLTHNKSSTLLSNRELPSSLKSTKKINKMSVVSENEMILGEDTYSLKSEIDEINKFEINKQLLTFPTYMNVKDIKRTKKQSSTNSELHSSSNQSNNHHSKLYQELMTVSTSTSTTIYEEEDPNIESAEERNSETSGSNYSFYSHDSGYICGGTSSNSSSRNLKDAIQNFNNSTSSNSMNSFKMKNDTNTAKHQSAMTESLDSESNQQHQNVTARKYSSPKPLGSIQERRMKTTNLSSSNSNIEIEQQSKSLKIQENQNQNSNNFNRLTLSRLKDYCDSSSTSCSSSTSSSSDCSDSENNNEDNINNLHLKYPTSSVMSTAARRPIPQPRTSCPPSNASSPNTADGGGNINKNGCSASLLLSNFNNLQQKLSKSIITEGNIHQNAAINNSNSKKSTSNNTFLSVSTTPNSTSYYKSSYSMSNKKDEFPASMSKNKLTSASADLPEYINTTGPELPKRYTSTSRPLSAKCTRSNRPMMTDMRGNEMVNGRYMTATPTSS